MNNVQVNSYCQRPTYLLYIMFSCMLRYVTVNACRRLTAIYRAQGRHCDVTKRSVRVDKVMDTAVGDCIPRLRFKTRRWLRGDNRLTACTRIEDKNDVDTTLVNNIWSCTFSNLYRLVYSLWFAIPLDQIISDIHWKHLNWAKTLYYWSTRWLVIGVYAGSDKPFTPIPEFGDHFAREMRCGTPPEFPLVSSDSGTLHHLPGRQI
jgi:hypothetical protein